MEECAPRCVLHGARHCGVVSGTSNFLEGSWTSPDPIGTGHEPTHETDGASPKLVGFPDLPLEAAADAGASLRMADRYRVSSDLYCDDPEVFPTDSANLAPNHFLAVLPVGSFKQGRSSLSPESAAGDYDRRHHLRCARVEQADFCRH